MTRHGRLVSFGGETLLVEECTGIAEQTLYLGFRMGEGGCNRSNLGVFSDVGLFRFTKIVSQGYSCEVRVEGEN